MTQPVLPTVTGHWTLTWDTFQTLRGSWDFYLNRILPQRPSKRYRVDGTASFIVAQLATSLFSLSLSTWTWDTFLTLRGTQGLYLNHVLSPRTSKSYRVVGTAVYIVAQPATCRTTLCPSSCCPLTIFLAGK